jgi:predicted transcriptional regulator
MQSHEISRLLTERYSAKILLATTRKPRTALELSDSLGIPIAACFRKIKLLEDAGLIICVERRLTPEGKRFSLFRSRVTDTEIVLERNKVRARIEMFDGSTQEVIYHIDLPAFKNVAGQTCD